MNPPQRPVRPTGPTVPRVPVNPNPGAGPGPEARWTPPAPPAPASGLAITSLVLSLLGLAIPAVIAGHIARGKALRSRGRIGGAGIALAALIIGYLSIAVVGIALGAGKAAPLLLRHHAEQPRMQCTQNLRQIGVVLSQFQVTYKSMPSNALAETQSEFAGLTGPKVFEQLKARSSFNYEPFLALPSQYSGNWLYYPRNPKTDPPDSVVLASPRIGPDRVVLLLDSTVKEIPDIEWTAPTLPAPIEIPAPVQKP